MSSRWGLLAAMLLLSACGLEAPKAPRFETDLYLPLGRQEASGQDLLDGSDYFGGDSTGASPIHFRLDGKIDAFTMDDLLDLKLPATSRSIDLSSLAFENPAPFGAGFSLRDLSGLDLPEDGRSVVVPAFSFNDARAQLAAQSAFEWIRFSGGSVRVTLRNGTLVPLGGSATPLVLRVRNRAGNRTAIEARVSTTIEPGAQVSTEIPLNGISLESELDVSVSGGSAGSGGLLVIPRSTDRLSIDVAFAGLAVDSLRAVVPAQSLSYSGTIDLSDDMGIRLSGGSVQDGGIAIALTNPLPLAVDGELRFPDLKRGGVAYTQPLSIPAAIGAVPGSRRTNLNLAGVEWATSAPRASLRYALEATTSGSGSRVVSLGLGQRPRLATEPATLRFARLVGSFTERRLSIPATETAIDPPEGLDRLDFDLAELALEVDNGVEVPAHALLRVEGLDPRNGPPITLDLVADIAAANGGPTRSRIDWTSATIPLLELIHSRPRRLRVGGELSVGSGSQEIEVRRDDRINGEYSMTAPLRARIGRVTYHSEPFHFRISPDVHDAIRDELISASAEGIIRNHFPAGFRVELAFAGDVDSLDASTVRLQPIRALAAATDSSGRVGEAMESTFGINISPEDLRFFARDDAWGELRMMTEGDSGRVVMVTAKDFVEVKALLRFRVRVEP